jgi:ADP-ribose pyrophosphatase YjhB (NUDIX family)
MTEPVRRDTARVILLAPDGRVLLFRHLLPDPWACDGWLTPGGGIDLGESPAETAARELAEETGHRFTPAALGGAVAVDSGPWSVDGVAYTTVNWYFAARAGSAGVDLSAMAAAERADVHEVRWWSPAELRAADAPVFPVGLADLAVRLAAGDRPAEPLRLPWV